jgi:cysteine synthase A
MIEALEASGELQPSSMLIEPTPGNPGVASTMDRTLIDEGLTIANESASKAAWKPPQLEGLSVGGLSGAAFLAGLDVGALHEMAGRKIAVIVPSFAGGYLSTSIF